MLLWPDPRSPRSSADPRSSGPTPGVSRSFFYVEYFRSISIKIGHPVEEQQRLWNKNIECAKKQVQYSEIEGGLKVGVIVCQSGDILIKVIDSEDKQPKYMWVSRGTFLSNDKISKDNGNKN